MKIKKVLAVLAVSALALSSMSCRATERYRRAQEEEAANRPLRCSKEFGRYEFAPGWIEAGSNGSDFYYYYPSEFEDYDVVPYDIAVVHSANDYSLENNVNFCGDEYQNIVEAYGEDAVNNVSNVATDGERWVTFEIITDDIHFYRWYTLGDYEQVLFELTINDEASFDDDDLYEVENGVYSFSWD